MPFFFENFAGKTKWQSLFFPVFGCAHRSCGGSAGGGKKSSGRRLISKQALMFCHVPQCDVMVPAQIGKNAPVHGPSHESAHCLSRKPFPSANAHPLFSIGMIGIITLIETSPDRFSLPPASPPRNTKQSGFPLPQGAACHIV